MKKFVTKAEVAEYMSDLAGRYMADGYIINTDGANRFYSDDSKMSIELRRRGKSTKAVRIAARGNDIVCPSFVGGLFLEVREFDLGRQGDSWFAGWWGGEVVERIDLFKISNRNGEVYTTDSEIAEPARRKREERAEARENDEKGGRSCLRPEQVIKLVRKRVGYGRAKVEDIEFVGKEVFTEGAVYYVRFNRNVSKTAERYLGLGVWSY